MEGQSVTAPHTFPLPIVGPLHKLYPFRKTHPPWAAVRISLLHCGPPWVAVSPPRGQPASPRSLLVNHPPTRTQHENLLVALQVLSRGKETLCPVLQTSLVLPQGTEGSSALTSGISIYFYQKAKQLMCSQTIHDVIQSTVC